MKLPNHTQEQIDNLHQQPFSKEIRFIVKHLPHMFDPVKKTYFISLYNLSFYIAYIKSI